MIGRAAAFAATACISCSAATAVDADSCTTLEFAAELAPEQQEGYVCFAFEAGADSRPISSSSIELAGESGLVLHHATLYTSAEARPYSGAFDCNPMPLDALAVQVAVPGSESLSLPADTALALRPDTRTFLIEAHLFRSSQAPAAPTRLKLCRARSTPAKLAGRFAVGASVPAIRPHQLESSTALCRLPFDLHLMYSWPHMHRVGHEFHAALLRGDQRIPIVDIEHWDFSQQLTYPVDIDAAAGDLIQSTCVWKNASDAYVLPGIFTENEMCTHGVTGYPSQAAYCEPQ
jgi:Copper type II ascorbate-dependent monooxygenase, C-terminal domain